MAHVGLLPDFIADLNHVGVTADELAPLFRSAETYILMWEKIELEDRDADGVDDRSDNCPYTANPEQEDCDLDGIGDVCDPDGTDNCHGIPGDLNNDKCVDRADYTILVDAIRGGDIGNMDNDLNGDGVVNISDARYLTTIFTNPRGVSCN